MPIIERGGMPIQNEEDLKNIRHHHERELGRVFLDRNFEVEYEPVVLEHENGNGKTSHVPDFGLKNLTSGTYTLIEATTSPYTEEHEDPKARARNIVEGVSEEKGEKIRYVVLYRQHLENIQEHNPDLDLDFFKGNPNYSPK